VPQKGDLARELLARLSDDAPEMLGETLYRDAGQAAVTRAAEIPAAMQAFAHEVMARATRDEQALARALGEYLTEPKAQVWFEASPRPRRLRAVTLDRRSRMMYDRHHVFLNGESWRAAGADARLMRRLADARCLSAQELVQASPEALDLLRDWCADGWLQPTVVSRD